jgi:hypothetical protein
MRGKTITSMAVCISVSLFVLMINPTLFSMQEESYEISSVQIGETDITLDFYEEIRLYTNKDYRMRIRVENSGENDLSYFTSLNLVGPEEIKISSWGKSTFSIPPGDSYEFIFMLEGLEPGEYELTLTAEEDFYAAITLIEDVLRLGILGFLPNLRMISPYLLGMLPFGAEMFFYLVLSDMLPPVIGRTLSVVEESPTVINSITYAIMRELDDLLIPLSYLLEGIAEDIPSTIGAWISSLPESIALLEKVLIDGFSYSIAHASSLATEGNLPLIEKFPEAVDGLLESLASCRFWGPNTAAISLENLLKIWNMENVTFAQHFLSDAVCLGLAGVYFFVLTPVGLAATPIYETYHENLLPKLKNLSSSMYNISSPVLHRAERNMNKMLQPKARLLRSLAEKFLPQIFPYLVNAAEVVAWATAVPVETFVNGAVEGFSRGEVSVSRLNSFCNNEVAPHLEKIIPFLWEKGAEYTPVPAEVERGKETITIKVRVRDMSPIESVQLRLADIWKTTLGTIKGLRTGEY